MQVVVKQKVHLQLFDEAVLRLLVVSFCRLFMLPARGDTVQMCVHYLSRTSVVDVMCTPTMLSNGNAAAAAAAGTHCRQTERPRASFHLLIL